MHESSTAIQGSQSQENGKPGIKAPATRYADQDGPESEPMQEASAVQELQRRMASLIFQHHDLMMLIRIKMPQPLLHHQSMSLMLLSSLEKPLVMQQNLPKIKKKTGNHRRHLFSNPSVTRILDACRAFLTDSASMNG